ncbi:SET domain-containing protein [Candidatus Falkowbacteria bacterium]|uniref:SET domain-containing protein n=1 Tax=Candidatus Buchananbacteria bacterium CG10_big_fil_rev_8_21_14_0_10_33_19 TaxID=1974525 RepID=A0A2H0W3X0_9BACT|nr:SET domain-containing protein [Candidatus Falkowbacteria bacterium]PIS06055.1 MAG: hypothetical protein COT80_04805 [Candidatus Buchananbacteria bacterium CG10_big_fil_rev_8_21_14_0_10_33_19]
MQPNLIVKKSGIAGQGVFTTVNFKAGQLITALIGRRMSMEEMIKTVDAGLEAGSDPLQIGDETYLDLEELYRSINHSCDPNSYISGENKLKALKAIKPGEEITFDYSTTMNDNEAKLLESDSILWTCKCKCGAKNCRKIIDQFKTLPQCRQKFYLDNKLAPDFILKKFG